MLEQRQRRRCHAVEGSRHAVREYENIQAGEDHRDHWRSTGRDDVLNRNHAGI
jgi:hypothetical protein